MGLENTIYQLSNINAVLGSTVGYAQDRQNGAPVGYALGNFGYNVYNGAMRNEMAHNIYQRTGSSLGHAVNIFAGYGNPAANYYGTVGMMGASMMSMPFSFGCGYPGMGFGMGMGYPMMGMGNSMMYPMMGGYMPSMFGFRGMCC